MGSFYRNNELPSADLPTWPYFPAPKNLPPGYFWKITRRLFDTGYRTLQLREKTGWLSSTVVEKRVFRKENADQLPRYSAQVWDSFTDNHPDFDVPEYWS